jgi:hypothetical protein
MRLMSAFFCGKRNKRGLGFPICGLGVTVPTSIKPKPSFPRASIYSPFLSKPAARPMGFLKVKPSASIGWVCTLEKQHKQNFLKNYHDLFLD